MAMVTIRIKCDNEAFSDGCGGSEVARILSDVAQELDGQDLERGTRNLRDINGNTVGAVTVTR